jgi:hypothetical protein
MFLVNLDAIQISRVIHMFFYRITTSSSSRSEFIHNSTPTDFGFRDE